MGVQMIEEKLASITGSKWVITDQGTATEQPDVWEAVDTASCWKEENGNFTPNYSCGITIMVTPAAETYASVVIAWELSVSIDIPIFDDLKEPKNVQA